MSTEAEATKNGQPITLGALIALLEARPQDHRVSFDFCSLTPMYLASYRGYYDHLALGWVDDEPAPTVAELLDRLRAADGSTFTGYKGGDFRMDRDTPVWVANYGHAGSTAIVGIAQDVDYWTIISTARCEDWDGALERACRVVHEGLGWGNAR